MIFITFDRKNTEKYGVFYVIYFSKMLNLLNNFEIIIKIGQEYCEKLKLWVGKPSD